MTVIAPICGTSTRFSKVSLYKLGYICTLLESPFHSESNIVILNLNTLVAGSYGHIIKCM